MITAVRCLGSQTRLVVRHWQNGKRYVPETDWVLGDPIQHDIVVVVLQGDPFAVEVDTDPAKKVVVLGASEQHKVAKSSGTTRIDFLGPRPTRVHEITAAVAIAGNPDAAISLRFLLCRVEALPIESIWREPWADVLLLACRLAGDASGTDIPREMSRGLWDLARKLYEHWEPDPTFGYSDGGPGILCTGDNVFRWHILLDRLDRRFRWGGAVDCQDTTIALVHLCAILGIPMEIVQFTDPVQMPAHYRIGETAITNKCHPYGLHAVCRSTSMNDPWVFDACFRLDKNEPLCAPSFGEYCCRIGISRSADTETPEIPGVLVPNNTPLSARLAASLFPGLFPGRTKHTLYFGAVFEESVIIASDDTCSVTTDDAKVANHQSVPHARRACRLAAKGMDKIQPDPVPVFYDPDRGLAITRFENTVVSYYESSVEKALLRANRYASALDRLTSLIDGPSVALTERMSVALDSGAPVRLDLRTIKAVLHVTAFTTR